MRPEKPPPVKNGAESPRFDSGERGAAREEWGRGLGLDGPERPNLGLCLANGAGVGRNRCLDILGDPTDAWQVRSSLSSSCRYGLRLERAARGEASVISKAFMRTKMTLSCMDS